MSDMLPDGGLAPRDRLAARPTGDLVKEVTEKVTSLARKEVELAKVELRADLQRELTMAKGLGVGALCALLGVNLLLVAAVFGLAYVMPAWGAALLVAGVLLLIAAIAGAFGWAKRVRQPLPTTRKTLTDDVHWAKERLA